MTTQKNTIEDSKIETTLLSDLAYKTEEINPFILLTEPSRAEKTKAEQRSKLQKSISKIPDEKINNIINLEETDKIYIFNKLKNIIKIEAKSETQDQVSLIFPSGKIEKFSPTSSIETLNKVYDNTYALDTACIGISIPKHASIIKSLLVSIKDVAKNTLSIRRELEKTEIELDQKKLDLENFTRNIESQSARSNSLNKEINNIEKNINNLHSLLIEKEKEISSLEDIKQNIAEERISIEKSLESLKNEIEEGRKTKENIEKYTTNQTNELTKIKETLENAKNEITELEQTKRLFDNELSGYNKEGKNQVKIYLTIATIITANLFLATSFTIYNGLELINNSTNMNMIELMISRSPLTIGISLIISMCFALTYFMISQSIKINSERMKFMQASIIAKDMWSASEVDATLTPFEREKLRQQAKIQLITRIFEESSNEKSDHKTIELIVEKLLSK